MRSISVAFNPDTLGEFDWACAMLVTALRKKRVKVSAAPAITSEFPNAKVIQRGDYQFRCVEHYNMLENKRIGRLDALYGKQVR